MTLNILRGLFVLLMAAVGWYYVSNSSELSPLGDHNWMLLALSVTLGVLFVCYDILTGREKLAVFSGTFFGLVVGLIFAYALSFVFRFLLDMYLPMQLQGRKAVLLNFANITVGIICCYLTISFILQTKDDFRFIIPYVEFRREARGASPIVVDTSALIDGRIADVAQTGIFDGQFIVPQFVIKELQDIADHPDRLKRVRGRRGLDVLAKLKRDRGIDLRIFDAAPGDDPTDDVDQRLIVLARELDGRALTTDFNLNKVAQLHGVPVINLNDLANALKQAVVPGETMMVEIVRPGSGSEQGIGYLEDGTMVVVENARGRINDEVHFTVTNTTTTSAGKMIFGRLEEQTGGNGATSTADGESTPNRRRPVRGVAHREESAPSEPERTSA